MAKLSISRCPFCGWKPGGRPNEFASTQNGPAVVCLGCGAGGPAALGMEVEQEDANDAKLHKMAVTKWNKRVIDKMMVEAARLIARCREIVDDDLENRAARHSLGRLHAELKHWLDTHRP